MELVGELETVRARQWKLRVSKRFSLIANGIAMEKLHFQGEQLSTVDPRACTMARHLALRIVNWSVVTQLLAGHLSSKDFATSHFFTSLDIASETAVPYSWITMNLAYKSVSINSSLSCLFPKLRNRFS